jgi:hypothetical protein
MPLTNFPIYNQIIDILRKRGKDINTDPIYQKQLTVKYLDQIPGPSLYRFFGTGFHMTTFTNYAIGQTWTFSKFPFRPMIILPVPTVDGTIDQKDS